MSAKATKDLIALKLPYSVLLKIREKYEILDEIMVEYEDYIEEHKPPYWDYKNIEWKKMSPYRRFKSWAEKVVRIVNSYKAATFTELLMDLHGDRKRKQALREQRRKEIKLKNSNIPIEERNEQSIMMLNQKVDMLTNIIYQQQKTMDLMK